MTLSFRRLVTLLAIVALAACGTPPPVVVDGVTDVQILGGDRTLPVGASTLLTAFVVGQNAATTVTWSSSEGSVASVSGDGLVTALEVGTTTVRATSTADPTQLDTIVVSVSADLTAAYTEQGMVVPVADVPAVLGMSILLFDAPDEVEVLTSSVTEIGEGAYLGPVSPVDADGRFTLAFPHADALPESVYAAADDFVLEARLLDDCELTPTDPVARVTTTSASFFLIPGPPLVAVTAEGLVLALTLEALVDVEDETLSIVDFPFPIWVHADRAVDVATSGAGCALGDPALDVDVTLVEGWNRLVWSFVTEEGTENVIAIELRNSASEDLFTYPVFGL